MKTIKDLCLINEGYNARVFPEDYRNMENKEDVVDCIIDTLDKCYMLDSMAVSVEESLDAHIFEDQDFLKLFGKKLSEAVMEAYEDRYE